MQNTVQNLKRIPDPVPTCKQAYSPDLEHLRRRNRELEQILDRVEKQTEDLKSQLSATETQLQKSDRDNEITNAKWVREKEAYMSRLQSGFETYRARSQVREEELQRERDDALSLVDALESKLEQTNVKTQQLQHMDLRIMLSKYEQELSKKDNHSADRISNAKFGETGQDSDHQTRRAEKSLEREIFETGTFAERF